MDQNLPPHANSAPRIAIWHFGAAAAFGLLPIVLFAVRLRVGEALLVISVAVLFACAAILTGGLFGFLFGIPRTLQQSETAVAQGPASGASVEPAYRVNTNLEQISDWLTKILVGVGLTQIKAIQTVGEQVSSQVSAGLGGGPSANVLASAIMVYFVIFGFLAGYLWTRLFLATELRRADLGALGAIAERASRQAEEATRKVDELQTQVQKDGAALALAIQQLTPTSGPNRPDLTAQLLHAVRDASARMRAQIYYMAAGHRSRTWRNDKNSMELTIPILRALIASDEQDRYFMNHAQLGFALKDKAQPDWTGAEQELSRAIELRGDWHEKEWTILEFNRAICRMRLDEGFVIDMPSSAAIRSRIVEDLRAASIDEWIRESILPGDPDVQKFLAINRITLKEIQP
jgi:hypothetical protein